MKKLITLLGSFSLVATSSIAVISCQVEIKGNDLKELATKFNDGKEVLAFANVNLTNAQSLQNDIIQLLTKTLVDKYAMDQEGYFKTTSISSVKIDTLDLVTEEEKNPNTKIDKQLIIGLKNINIVIAENNFVFQINFIFNS